MEGSACMGAAEAILEEHVIGADGLHMGPNLLDYKIPTSLDVPELIALLVESNDPEGPRGAKEAGEGPLHPSIPAIANAIYDAVGVRIDRLPFSPARVLAALREKRSASPRGAGGGVREMLPLPIFEYHKPRTLAEATGLLASLGDKAMILAGGLTCSPT